MRTNVEISWVEWKSIVDESICQPIESNQAEIPTGHFFYQNFNIFILNIWVQ